MLEDERNASTENVAISPSGVFIGWPSVGAKKGVLVLMNGDPLAIDPIKTTIPTIVEAFEGGQAAGTGLASVLFGDGKTDHVV